MVKEVVIEEDVNEEDNAEKSSKDVDLGAFHAAGTILAEHVDEVAH